MDKSVFPLGQGGAINSQIAAKALCFELAGRPDFAEYAHQIVKNAATLADTMAAAGARIVAGGTDNHMFLVDLRSIDPELTGKKAARTLDEVGVTLNFNTIPNDPRKPAISSGIRIGTPSATSTGMKEPEMVRLGTLMMEVLRSVDDEIALKQVEGQIAELSSEFPGYPADFAGHV